MYSSRAQVKQDLKEALQRVRDLVGNGYKPKSEAVTANPFDEGFQRNGFGWVTVAWEISLVKKHCPELF